MYKGKVYLPCQAVFAVSFSGINSHFFIIAGTALTWHTLLVVVHVGSLRTPTAIDLGEADLTRVVSLAERLAGPTTVGHVVAILCSQ